MKLNKEQWESILITLVKIPDDGQIENHTIISMIHSFQEYGIIKLEDMLEVLSEIEIGDK